MIEINLRVVGFVVGFLGLLEFARLPALPSLEGAESPGRKIVENGINRIFLKIPRFACRKCHLSLVIGHLQSS
jgi:hypothetical protein